MPIHVSLDILWVEDQALGRRDAGESEVNDWKDEPLGSLHDGRDRFSCKRFQSVCDVDGYITRITRFQRLLSGHKEVEKKTLAPLLQMSP